VDAIKVLLDIGCRCGEIWCIQARDVHEATGMLAIWENKADHPRSVPMTSRVKEILKRRAGRYPTGKLFPFENPWLRNQWDRVKAVMKLENDDQFVPHCLRHTCASRLVQRGLSIVKVQKWLGHKTIQITLRYAHLAPADLLEGAAMLEPLAAKVLEQPTGTPIVPPPEVLVVSPVTGG
jgi:integrase